MRNFTFTLIATLVMASGNAFAASLQAELIEVPVLKERTMRNEIITPSMIAWRKLPASRVPSNTIRDDAALIGMQLTRHMSANAMLMDHALRIPPDVAKNSNVTVVLNHPSIQLAMRGKALQDGLVGESVKVMNERSRKIFTATIIEPNKVQVN